MDFSKKVKGSFGTLSFCLEYYDVILLEKVTSIVDKR